MDSGLYSNIIYTTLNYYYYYYYFLSNFNNLIKYTSVYMNISIAL